MEALRADLYALVEASQPCTVRHVYYLGIGRLWEKDTGKSRRNYSVPVRELGHMRENGTLPWEWITDGTRLVRQETQYDSLDDALERTTEMYRRNLWSSQPRRVEVWCESDSISGVLHPITSAWGVGLFSCRGQSSKTFVHEAVREYQRLGKPLSIIFAGDWDPSGRSIPRSVVERMERYNGSGLDLHFQQIAVTADDVRSGQLTTHDVNTADANFKRFQEECQREGLDPHGAVEVEALAPGLLRQRLDEAIETQIEDVHQWNVLARVEKHDRTLLRAVKDAVGQLIEQVSEEHNEANDE
ncbi:hypothetical protein ACFYNM_38770 [Streptomyces spororaveus]|uniref:hypothetical protein n=1 Tax=Streptomyces spororaveus TaxID=284039 RepID=UPI0036B6B37E